MHNETCKTYLTNDCMYMHYAHTSILYYLVLSLQKAWGNVSVFMCCLQCKSWEANDSTNRLKSKTGCLTVRTRNHSHQTERSNNKQSQKCTEVGPALWILQPYVKICLHQAKPRHFPPLYWHRLPSGYPQRERGLILSATYSLSSTVTSFFTMWYMLYHILPSLWWFSAATNATRDI